MADLKYWLWLSTRKGIGAKGICTLLEVFGSPENIYFARENDYKGFERDLTSLLDKDMRPVKRIMDFCAENDVTLLTLNDSQYPDRLRNIDDPPVVLYIKGHLPPIDEEPVVSVVGTRSCTVYGLKSAERISYELSRSGVTVVTGLAKGIDSAAVRGALRAGGHPIGVLGCGIDVVYPRENGALFRDVAAMGAIITEYPPGTAPDGKNFPVRNRIISGLSSGVLVVEAPERSGALITAAKALEQGRDVFAIPGNIDADSCRGSNGLLREGAIPVTGAFDIIEEYRMRYPSTLKSHDPGAELDGESFEKLIGNELPYAIKRQKEPKKVIDNGKTENYIDLVVDRDEFSEDELAVIDAIKNPGTHVDEIIENTGLVASRVLAALTMLEIKGGVKQEPGKRYTVHISVK